MALEKNPYTTTHSFLQIEEPNKRNPYTETNSFLQIEEPVTKISPVGLRTLTIKEREYCGGRKTPSYIYEALQEARTELENPNKVLKKRFDK